MMFKQDDSCWIRCKRFEDSEKILSIDFLSTDDAISAKLLWVFQVIDLMYLNQSRVEK